MRLLCTPCWERGTKAPAVNTWDVRRFGLTARCEDCENGAAEQAAERSWASYWGGWVVSEFERSQDARRFK